jgi:sterol desaturase/sphingolipid hydroxylase (fatty acid hydroxylase superfamily)
VKPNGSLASIVIKLAIALARARLSTLLGIAIIFVPLERLMPLRRNQRLFRSEWGQDFLHFFLGGIATILLVELTLAPLPAFRRASPLSVRHLPGWLQFIIFEASWTLLGYWVHRLLHVSPQLWKLHSIHESSREIDWLSAFRLHWLEPVIFQVLTIAPLLVFQIQSPRTRAYTIYAYLTSHIHHANVALPVGPLKYIFPTPQFHRWHHARDTGRPNCNFGQYPFWDFLFGTLYLPDAQPERYGDADDIPTDVLAQQAYPFGLHRLVLALERWVRDRVRVMLHGGYERREAEAWWQDLNASADEFPARNHFSTMQAKSITQSQPERA